jgi:hypothetical protein
LDLIAACPVFGGAGDVKGLARRRRRGFAAPLTSPSAPKEKLAVLKAKKRPPIS